MSVQPVFQNNVFLSIIFFWGGGVGDVFKGYRFPGGNHVNDYGNRHLYFRGDRICSFS